MLLDKGRRARMRVSLEHLDPTLYARLEAGDELVVYVDSIAGVKPYEGHVQRYGVLCEALAKQRLTCVLLDEAITQMRMVWEIVDVADIASAAA